MPMRPVWVSINAALLGWGALGLSVGAHGQMVTSGSFEVSDVGGATYSVPISVPPGIGGVAPQLALTYNSQAGSSMMGVGWNLSGVSAISRCAKSIYQDGRRGNVSFTDDDAYCLDGRRMYGETVGGKASQYRFKPDSFSIVYPVWGAQGPDSFKVKTKEGLTLYFGGENASLGVPVLGSSMWRTWAISKAMDSSGNYMTFAYDKDVGARGLRVRSIEYAGNEVAGITPRNMVYFHYEDIPAGYASSEASSGAIIATTKRLVRIQSVVRVSDSSGRVSEQEFGEYRISYEPGVDNYHFRVSSVVSCTGPAADATSKCLLPINMAWTGGKVSYKMVDLRLMLDPPVGSAGASQEFVLQPSQKWIVEDVNNDGRSDLIVFDGPYYYVFVADVSGAFRGQRYQIYNGWNFGAPQTSDQTAPIKVDLNGDGSPDWLWLWKSGWYYLWSGKKFGDSSYPIFSAPPDKQVQWSSGLLKDGNYSNFLVVNTNGSAKSDLIAFRSPSATDEGELQYYRNNGDFTFTPNASIPLRTALMAAEGLTDCSKGFTVASQRISVARLAVGAESSVAMPFSCTGAAVTTEGVSTVRINGSGGFNGFSSLKLSGGSGTYFQGSLQDDVNADGLNDWVRWGGKVGGVISLAINKGLGFDAIYAPPAIPNPVSSASLFLGRMSLNVNGDEWPDAVVFPTTYDQGYFQILLGRADGSMVQQDLRAIPADLYSFFSMVETGSTPQTLSGDFDGDGRTDFAMIGLNRSALWLSGGAERSDLLKEIIPGAGTGASVKLSYKSLREMESVGRYADYRVLNLPGNFRPAEKTLVVVDQVSMANGAGGAHEVKYNYGVAYNDYDSGHGFLGFNWVEHLDVPSGLISRTYYRLDYPFLGRVAMTAELTSTGFWTGIPFPVPLNPGSYLKLNTNEYFCQDTTQGFVGTPACDLSPGHFFQVYASKVVSTGQDLDGTPQPGEQTEQEMDSYGNPVTIKVTTLNSAGNPTGHKKTTRNTYANDTKNWFLGRLLRSEVTVESP
jgi:hypothetical protein